MTTCRMSTSVEELATLIQTCDSVKCEIGTGNLIWDDADSPPEAVLKLRKMRENTSPTAALKAHLFRDMINELRDTATAFHNHDSLRERLRKVVNKYIDVA